MSTQTYANHAHQPVPTFIGSAFWLMAVGGLVACWLGYDRWGQGFLLAGVMLCLLMLLSIGRLYTTKLQDRIIMLEEKLRVASLLTPAQQARFAELTPKQVAALRFASDAELPALFERTVAEGLKPDAIKRAVTHWRADHNRT
jgi:Family of unknown function (DUF6526)